jgi:hypothetical protein
MRFRPPLDRADCLIYGAPAGSKPNPQSTLDGEASPRSLILGLLLNEGAGGNALFQ